MSQLEISQICTNGNTQPRANLKQDLIDEYAEAMTQGAEFPPVTVFYDGNIYWLSDGFHRIRAAAKIGITKILVDIIQGTRRDAVLYSFRANATHGLRRSNTDKRRAVLILLSDIEWSKWSNNEIAKRCGVGEWLVRKIKEELSSCKTKIDCGYAKKYGVSQDTLKQAQQRIIAQSKERVAQRNGTIYSVSTENIGKYSKVPDTKKSDIIEIPETKVSELELISDDTPILEEINQSSQQQKEELEDETIQLNNSLIEKPSEILEKKVSDLELISDDTPIFEQINICAQQQEGEVKNGTIKKNNGLIEKPLEKIVQLPPENINSLDKESSDNYIRIIKIRQDNPQQIEEVIQKFELNFSCVTIEVEGYSKILITLFQQMQDNPAFTKKILEQAQLV
ncbi:hypothetical protein NIES267_38940 [Calothrix parasitica NIES-267]|uniref:ParB-like N-terminal domain-containing protein n=1 Tax=Calothrix parasitica NIES-267 TaxID=1973488 RepID=A0A1Z4LTL7_9CYAN|nr:hypothetical protein NIES267_38940 [Calothrix parasitica NIES-267]